VRQSHCEPHLKELGVAVCLQTKQYAAGRINGTTLPAISAVRILCEVWDSCCGVAEYSSLLGCDFRKIVLPLSSASTSQRKVVAVHDGQRYTDIGTANFIFGHYF
jgi:hypothetical protein